MNAAVETKQKRGQYRTKRWWALFDAEMRAKFPKGATAKAHRGRGYVDVMIVSDCTRGRVEVRNPLSGAQYVANVELLVPPSARTVEQMAAFVAAERARQAEEQARARTRPSVVRSYLQPITTADKRSPDYVDKARMLPLSSDELTAYTALSAICKTLNTLHLNRDSFRNPKLFDLLRASHTCLAECIREMETYDELPGDT